jgi:hypothetical protein
MNDVSRRPCAYALVRVCTLLESQAGQAEGPFLIQKQALVHVNRAASRPEPSPATIAPTFKGTPCALKHLKVYSVKIPMDDVQR